MTDVKLLNGDVALDSAGRMIRLGDTDAQFQRAFICASVKKGSYIYDRSLGCDYVFDPDDSFAKRKVSLGINEALARFGNARASVLDINTDILLQITIDGESRTEEVRLLGDI